MTQYFANKVVLITGGSRGIGRAMVEGFARSGAKVIYTYVQPGAVATDIESSLRDQGFAVSAARADVRSSSEIVGLVELIEREHGQLDVLVNNAGITRDSLIMAMEQQSWDDVLETNLTGVFHCVKPVAQLMMRRRQGAIINVSSVVATRPGRGHCNYAASKGGLEAMTKALAVELAPRNIRVNCIAPGMIETDMSKELRDLAGDQILARIPLKRYGRPEEIAKAALFLASDQASYITGTTLHVDGGLIV